MSHRIISCSAIIVLLASVAVGTLSMPSGAMAFGQGGGGEVAEATSEAVAWGEVMAEGLAEAISAALVEATLVGATSAEAISAA
jgi:hypothetical protein